MMTKLLWLAGAMFGMTALAACGGDSRFAAIVADHDAALSQLRDATHQHATAMASAKSLEDMKHVEADHAAAMAGVMSRLRDVGTRARACSPGMMNGGMMNGGMAGNMSGMAGEMGDMAGMMDDMAGEMDQHGDHMDQCTAMSSAEDEERRHGTAMDEQLGRMEMDGATMHQMMDQEMGCTQP